MPGSLYNCTIHFSRSDLKPYLQEPNNKQTLPSATLLEAVGQSSSEAMTLVLELSLPVLMEGFNQHSMVIPCFTSHFISWAPLLFACDHWHPFFQIGDRRILVQVLLPLLKLAANKEVASGGEWLSSRVTALCSGLRSGAFRVPPSAVAQGHPVRPLRVSAERLQSVPPGVWRDWHHGAGIHRRSRHSGRMPSCSQSRHPPGPWG